MIRELRVFNNGRPIGLLREARTNKFTFTYDPTVDPADLVSVRLPVDPDRYPPGQTAGWLAGLLPDTEWRELLAQTHEFPAHFDLRVLAATGSDLPGAIVVLEADDDPLPPGAASGSPIDLDTALAVGEVGGVRVDGQWCTPLHGTPSSHWLRPEDPMLPGAVAAEAFGLAVAAELGLPVAEPSIWRIEDVPVLAVARPDRSIEVIDGGDVVERHHSEDLAQVCGVDTARHPDAIYEEQGGPGYLDIAEHLFDHSSEPRDDLRLLVEMMVAHLVVGNSNGHAGTFTFLLPEQRLGPVHSMLPTEWFTEVETDDGVLELEHRLAMSVNDIWRSDGIDYEDLVMEASRWPTLSRTLVTPWIDAVLEAVPDALERAVGRLGEVPSSLPRDIEERANALSRD